MTFEAFCDKYCINLQLTSTYIPESSGAPERGVGLVNAIMKKIKEEGPCFEEALAAFKNIRNESGFSKNQLLSLRNWRDPNVRVCWRSRWWRRW